MLIRHLMTAKSSGPLQVNRLSAAWWVLVASWMVMVGPAQASTMDELTDMSLEDLMNIEVTSVSKKRERLADAAAAIFVLTSADIQRQGATNIPEALRLVPGLQVARIDASKWAITSRGFNGRFANKLLVLLDGRSVYTPLFAGVYWEALDMPIEDIERIEVIRGPGGTLWGANAVNGVINIMTKKASDTQGGLVSMSLGNEESGAVTLRHGGRFSDQGSYRIYGRFDSRDESWSALEAHDDSELGQLGFRADWAAGEHSYTLQGDIYDGTAGQQLTTPFPPGATVATPAQTTFVEDVELYGHNLLFRWSHQADDNRSMSLQFFYEKVKRDGEALYENRDIFDFDFQSRLPVGQYHDVIWGLGFRHTRDNTRGNLLFSLDPRNKRVNLYSAFIQDEISLDDQLKLVVGSKFEHNDFTGLELQPNIRLSWLANRYSTVWGALSRAVRTPSRGENDVRLAVLTTPPAATVTLIGSSDYDAEVLTALEFGYRYYDDKAFNFDATVFINDYAKLRTFDALAPGANLLMPFDNNMDGRAWGIELASDWKLGHDWEIRAAYTYFDLSLDLENTSTSITVNDEKASPRHQASILSAYRLNNFMELDTTLRYVDDIEVQGTNIDAYLELDARLLWKAMDGLELELVGKNLLDKSHPEFVPTFIQTQATEIERGVHLNLRWRY